MDPLHNRWWDSLESRSKAHPRCPAPLDWAPHPNRPTYESAHNPADQLNTPPPLRYAKGTRPSKAQHAGDARNSTQHPNNTPHDHSHHFKSFASSFKPPLRRAKGTRAKHAGDARKSQPLRHSRTHQRHSRRRGNPEKNKPRRFPSSKPPAKFPRTFPDTCVASIILMLHLCHMMQPQQSRH